MKKQILIAFVLIGTLQGFSYTWQSYGPENIYTTNLFLPQNYAEVLIMSDSGLFVVINYQSWQYLPFPAKDAVSFDNDEILFVASDGSTSDGIYNLNLFNYQVDLIENCPNPNFIKCNEETEDFFVGYESGLLKSEDGTNWEEMPFFTGRNCVGMEFFNGHMIVNTLGDLSHLFLSDDDGITWAESTGCPGWITGMTFSNGGILFGVFPDNSYSSGLWSSEDFGNTWEIEFYSTNLNTIYSNSPYSSEILLGWKNSDVEYKGIAVYNPSGPPPGLIFLNENLPNTNINKINFVSLLDVGIILVATPNGVFMCPDYFVGINDLPSVQNIVQLFPNPVHESTVIKIDRHIHTTDYIIIICNSMGIKVDELTIDNLGSEANEFTWNKGNLPAGVYYLVLRTKNETFCEKFIVL